MKNLLFIIFLVLMINLPCFSWTGYDYDNDALVEIERGQLVRSSEDVEVFNFDKGEYNTVQIQNISDNTVEFVDYDTGDYGFYEME